MKVFFTGGAGIIGNSLTDRLLPEENGIRKSRAPTSEEGIHFSALVIRFDGNHASLAIGPSMLNVFPCA